MKEGRVCVTHDDDFLRIHATGAEYSGIAYVHQKRLTIGETVLALVTLAPVMACVLSLADKFFGRLCVRNRL